MSDMRSTNVEVEQKVFNHSAAKDAEHGTPSTDPSGTPPDKDPEVIFDTGLISWLQVLGSFFLFFNSW